MDESESEQRNAGERTLRSFIESLDAASCFLAISMARSRWTPREPLTRTTSPGRRFCDEPLAGGFGIGEKNCGDSAGAGGGGQVLGVALHGDDEIEASLGGGAAAGGVQRGTVLAHLQHFAGDQDAAASGGARGEGADHGAQRLGIGVVAVVENGGAGDLDDLAALVAGGERSDARRRRHQDRRQLRARRPGRRWRWRRCARPADAA